MTDKRTNLAQLDPYFSLYTLRRINGVVLSGDFDLVKADEQTVDPEHCRHHWVCTDLPGSGREAPCPKEFCITKLNRRCQY